MTTADRHRPAFAWRTNGPWLAPRTRFRCVAREPGPRRCSAPARSARDRKNLAPIPSGVAHHRVERQRLHRLPQCASVRLFRSIRLNRPTCWPRQACRDGAVGCCRRPVRCCHHRRRHHFPRRVHQPAAGEADDAFLDDRSHRVPRYLPWESKRRLLDLSRRQSRAKAAPIAAETTVAPLARAPTPPPPLPGCRAQFDPPPLGGQRRFAAHRRRWLTGRCRCRDFRGSRGEPPQYGRPQP